MSTPEPGLRELKKQMTREAIASAALRLTLEKGLNEVTVDEIAHEAFVSPRTVSNYFASKEEAVVAAAIPDWLSVVEDYAVGPVDQLPLAALCRLFSAFVRTLTSHELALLEKTCSLVDQYPALHPYETAAYAELEETLKERVATRSGVDMADNMYPWLVAAAAVSAIRSAVRLWVASDGSVDQLVGHIQDAFNQFSDGLPAPQNAASKKLASAGTPSD